MLEKRYMMLASLRNYLCLTKDNIFINYIQYFMDTYSFEMILVWKDIEFFNHSVIKLDFYKPKEKKFGG